MILPGQLAKIVQLTPHRESGRRVGHVGVVEQMTADGSRVLLTLLTLDGETDGAVFVPAGCLTAVDDDAWAAALANHRRIQQENALRDFQQRLQRQQQIEAVADKYQLTVDAALEIAAVVIGQDAEQFYY